MIKDILLFLFLSAPIVVFLGLFILILDKFTYKQITQGTIIIMCFIGLTSFIYPLSLQLIANLPYYYGKWIGSILKL